MWTNVNSPAARRDQAMRRLVIGLAAAAGLAVVSGSAVAAEVWGASASGSATASTRPCPTCDYSDAELSYQEDGGPGQTSALVEFNTTDAGYLGSATLGDAIAPIDLGVSATAGIQASTAYQAYGSAVGTQQFTYLGAERASFTVVYAIDGELLGDFITQIYGGLTVYDGTYDPTDEVHATLGDGFSPDDGADTGSGFAYSRLAGDCAPGDCAPQAIDLSGGVSFEVDPGETFFVMAQLYAQADSRFLESLAYVDAAHTLAVSFSAGNASLLQTPSVSVVPEPATWAVMLLGFGGAGACLRSARRRRVPTPA